MNIVFASGVLVPQHLLGEDYFRGAKNAFPGSVFPQVPTLGDIAQRAQALAEQIATLCPSGDIHIIAHSMGGLDSRFLLHNNLQGLTSRVATLSTISTPHWGSPLADLLVGAAPNLLDPRRLTFDILTHAAADLKIPAGALAQLTTGFAKTFNSQNPDADGVRYYCYAGSGMESFILKPGNLYIQAVGGSPDEKMNDGVVNVASASWKPLAESPWNTADHFSELGYNLNVPGLVSSFDHLTACSRIISRATSQTTAKS